jgi:hypothetical protein
METLLGLCIGIDLSAACVFRVFVPLLALPVFAAVVVSCLESWSYAGCV